VELTDLAAEDEHVFACPDCAGLWVDGSQLNALLLHNTLPGLDSMGGRADPDADTGTCHTCGVSLVHIDAPARRDSLSYECCEDCGFVAVPDGDSVPADIAAASASLVSFFRRFSAKPAAAKR
jgi:predicted RNA-binding Zn-ribbon protein involved in translation (DUF1610 family)